MVSSILKGLVTNNGIGRYETLLKQASSQAVRRKRQRNEYFFFVV